MTERTPFEGIIEGAWLYTGRDLVRNGAVRIRAGRIMDILSGGGAPRVSSSEERFSFPQGLIHPGLVNAHTHLDLSGLRGKFEPGPSFIDWLERVRASRLQRRPEELEAAVRQGVEELVSNGMTTVIDYSFEGLSEGVLEETSLRKVILREVLGLEPDRVERSKAAMRAWLQERPDGERTAFGLAPHAPYSTSAELIRACGSLAHARPVAIHLAEDRAEREFLECGKGPFRDLLERLNISSDHFKPPTTDPVTYMARLGLLKPNTLLVHANDLTGSEIGAIAKSGARVIFCPGTHAYFERPVHPLPDLLAAGVGVGLGTDSAASNRSLSVIDEMRQAHRFFPALSPETVFALGTGALLGSVLPWAGELRVGEAADLAVSYLDVEVPLAGEKPLNAFLEGDGPCLMTLAQGEILFQSG